MEFLGLTLEDYAEQNSCEVWPDNWPALMFFQALGYGSWNMGPNGPVGLRPESFREVRRALRVPAADWPEIHEALLIMQDAALEEIYKD